MKIVILDAHTLNPGDLSWAAIEQFGETIKYPRTPPHLVIERCQDAAIVLTNKSIMNREVIEQLPQLKFIAVTATGHNVVDIEAAKTRGIPVSNVAGYGAIAVAQHVFALLLELTNQVGIHSESVKQGEWTQASDWCYWKQPLIELAGLTMGIVGMGDIGQRVAKLADAFGMKVIYHSRSPKNMPYQAVELDTIFTQSDVISFHCPLTPETAGLLSAKRLQEMKSTAFFINTGRGGLVDEPALAGALMQKQIAGAAVDVLSTEPPKADNPLLTAPNCLITPHHAWGSQAARQRLMDILVENIRCFLAGKPQNVVNHS
ncbi:MAG: D-2-hydroxyacid dehydrogenase [Flammeovirgaceae bacterium]